MVATVVTMMAMPFLRRRRPAHRAIRAHLVAQYTTMRAMETVAIATFLRDAHVAPAGGAATLPAAAVAVAVW